MNTVCIVVADAKYARFFSIEPGARPHDRTKLVQRSMLSNPDVEGVRRGGAGSRPDASRRTSWRTSSRRCRSPCTAATSDAARLDADALHFMIPNTGS